MWGTRELKTWGTWGTREHIWPEASKVQEHVRYNGKYDMIVRFRFNI